MNVRALAESVGLDLSRFSTGEQTAICNALYAAHTKGYLAGHSAARKAI